MGELLLFHFLLGYRCLLQPSRMLFDIPKQQVQFVQYAFETSSRKHAWTAAFRFPPFPIFKTAADVKRQLSLRPGEARRLRRSLKSKVFIFVKVISTYRLQAQSPS